jgi:galactokinase
VANAGPRYTPELNVELPVAQLFDGLGRTSAFFDRFDEQVSAVKQAHREAASRNAREVAESEYNTLAQRIKVFSDAATNAKKDGVGPIDWRSLVESVSAAFNAIEACIGKLEELSKEKTTAVEEEQRLQRQKELYSSARYSLHHLRGVVYF